MIAETTRLAYNSDVDNYLKQLCIDASPQELYDALTTQKGLASWLTRQTEIYPHIGGIATFHFGKEKYLVMKITKIEPYNEVVWKCVEQYYKIPGTDKTDELVGTSVKFTITENKDKTTTLTFLHNGLTPKLFCFKKCKREWDYYLVSLKKYLETGKGRPFNSRK